MSDKYDSVNERTQEISKSMKLHTLGCGKMPMKFIRQLANVADCFQFFFNTVHDTYRLERTLTMFVTIGHVGVVFAGYVNYIYFTVMYAFT